MKISFLRPTARSQGSALLIVLAFLLLLTTLTVAFLSRATFERQLSNASFSQGKVDLAGQGAIAAVIGDLQQEIVAGSTGGSGNPTLASGYYYPNSPLTVVPCPVVPINSFNYTPSSIVGSGMENLLKISQRGTTFWSGANYPAGTTYYSPSTGPQRAASVATTAASLNGRLITPARWNAPLLMEPVKVVAGTSTTDFTPPSAFAITNPPDWIYVARDGSNPGNDGTSWSSSWSSTSTNPVTQRYAYAIYDEGSTLDMNVAGSPISTPGSSTTGTYSNYQPYKSALAYADLLQLPYNASTTATLGSTLSTAQTEAFVNAIVGWRNFGSSGLGSTYLFPNSYPFVYTNGTPSSGTAANYDQNILFNPGGFMTVCGLFSTSKLGLGTGPNMTGSANQSDNAFGSRQQLLQFFLQGLGQNSTFTGNSGSGLSLASLENLLPYLGTFSRDVSQPSYAPNPSRPTVLQYTINSTPYPGNTAYGADATVNPAFLNTVVQSGKTFTRNDGSTAIVGEPLVKKRFALNRLAWLTYEGPTGGGTDIHGTTLSALSPTTDTNMKALIADGIPASFLAQGTTANIQKYFGLEWDNTNHVWDYDWHNNGGAPATGSKGPIMQLGAIAALATPHDPDFFELLKATINVGSIGKALSYSNSAIVPASYSTPEQPYNYNHYAESSVDFQILQIGANIIAQSQPASYPPRIVFDDGSNQIGVPRTIVGNENLPYLDMVMNGTLRIREANPPYTDDGTKTGSYVAGTTITDTGVGAWMQEPVIWNPYDPLSPTGAVGPTNFRIVAASATPDGATASKLFVYGSSVLGSRGGTNNFSPGAKTGSTYTTPSVSSVGTFVDTTDGSIIAHQFTYGDTEIDFSLGAAPTKELCPEPVILLRSSFKDNNNNTFTVTVPTTTAWMYKDTIVSPSYTSTSGYGLKSDAANVNAPGAPISTSDPAGTYYIGFYLGAFPLAWTPSGSTTPCSADQSGGVLARAGGTSGKNPPGYLDSCYMTYQMQYKDSNGNWIPYDTKYGQAADTVYGTTPGQLLGAALWTFATDPRTSRFGLLWNDSTHNAVGYNNPVTTGGIFQSLPANYFVVSTKFADWLDVANGIIYTLRPDADAGFFSMSGWPAVIGPSSGWMAYIASGGAGGNYPAWPGGLYQGIAPGLLSQNNTDSLYITCHGYGDGQGSSSFTPNYFADPDGMVRRGMGAYLPLGNSSSPESSFRTPPADTTVGLPMARVFGWNWAGAPTSPDPTIKVYPGTSPTSAAPTSQAQSRPYFLHRPFYSVAELGYVFSDTPWRNLDFFTAESGNVGLLDVFCVNDTNDPGGLVAGKVNLNTRQSAVLQAVLAGGCADPGFQQPLNGSSGPVGQIDPTTAGLIAKALVTRTTDTANIGNGTGPLQNVSDLVGKYIKSIAIQDMGATLIPNGDQGTLNSVSGTTNYNDGKLSYAGFSGGVWDNSSSTAHAPYPNPYSSEPNPYTSFQGGVEDFTTTTGAPKSISAPEDIYAAYMQSSSSFTSNANHNGSRETVTTIQRFREAPIRALAAAGTTRVWNLMIDVIAQTGRFPSSAGSLADFNVEGERRYWVHVAIDRSTGKILDEQVEEVKE